MHDKDILKNLKAQFFDTSQRYGDSLIEYYVLLCCDSKKNKDTIRAIEKQFDKQERVTVIEPEYTLSFLHLGERTIDAIVKAKLGNEDIVYQKALAIVAPFSPTEKAILFYFIWRLIYGQEKEITLTGLKSASFLVKIYQGTSPIIRTHYSRREKTEVQMKGEPAILSIFAIT